MSIDRLERQKQQLISRLDAIREAKQKVYNTFQPFTPDVLYGMYRDYLIFKDNYLKTLHKEKESSDVDSTSVELENASQIDRIARIPNSQRRSNRIQNRVKFHSQDNILMLYYDVNLFCCFRNHTLYLLKHSAMKTILCRYYL